MDAASRRETCAKCGATVPVDPGCTAWCECGWNLVPDAPDPPRGRIADLYRRMGERFGERLFDEVVAHGAARPRPTATRLALQAIAAGVVLTPLAAAVGAVLLPVLQPRNPIAWTAAMTLALLAVALRPRAFRIDPRYVTTAKSHPRLRSLVHQVARAVGTEPPDIVAVVPDLNAYAARVGFRQRTAVLFGGPLLATLEPQEIVALAGHEVAHFANGDTARRTLVATAITMLEVWCDVLAPDPWDAQRGWAQTLAAGGMWLVSLPPRALLALVVHLMWMDSQRAEYFADRLGAEISGSEAFTGMLEQSVAGWQRIVHSCHRVVVAKAASSVIEDFRAGSAAVPARERERLRRRAAAEPTALDATHPPTGRRIRCLREHPARRPRVVLDARWRDEILREIGPDLERSDREWSEWYRSSLYSGHADASGPWRAGEA